MNKHLKYIDSLPCVICGRESTHHHLLRVRREYLPVKEGEECFLIPKVKSKGMGTKSDDRFCLPVCVRHHEECHRYGNDRAYFNQYGIGEPERLALYLWENSGDIKKGKDIIKWYLIR